MGCIRGAFGVDDAPLGEPSANWSLALQLGANQKLLPLLHTGVEKAAHPVAACVRTALRAEYLKASLRLETHIEPVLQRTIAALTAAGIEFIVLKGAALAYVAYPAPAARTMGDVDLLLPAGEVHAANSVLRELGFRADETHVQATHHLRPLFLAALAAPVELHHKLLAEPHPFRVDLSGFWARSRIRRVGGIEARVLAPVDALLHTCVHMAGTDRYGRDQLRSLTDILAITSGSSDLDWELFVHLVGRSRTAGAVYWPLALARLWLGAAVPDRVLSKLAPPRALGRVLASMTEPPFILQNLKQGQWAGHTLHGSDTLYDLLVTASVHTGCSPFQQARALVRTAFPARPRSRAASRSTGSRLSYAAYLLRPARFVRAIRVLGRIVSRLART